MYHGKTRPDLNKDCPEALDLQFLKWVWGFRKTRIPRIMKLLDKYKDKKVIILHSPKETKKLLQGVKALGQDYFTDEPGG
ncbi:topology modulation protein [compost metagenome]